MSSKDLGITDENFWSVNCSSPYLIMSLVEDVRNHSGALDHPLCHTTPQHAEWLVSTQTAYKISHIANNCIASHMYL
jgi:hypothetical protein